MQDASLPVGLACLLALLTGAGVILATRPVYGAVALLGHSLVLAGLFILLSAELVALAQVLIYAGAVVVLFLFVVLLLPSGGAELPSGPRTAAALVGGGTLLVALAVALASGAPSAAARPTVNVPAVGRALFGPLLPAFELTAPLLLVAIVGAVVIWRRHEETR